MAVALFSVLLLSNFLLGEVYIPYRFLRSMSCFHISKFIMTLLYARVNILTVSTLSEQYGITGKEVDFALL